MQLERGVELLLAPVHAGPSAPHGLIEAVSAASSDAVACR